MVRCRDGRWGVAGAAATFFSGNRDAVIATFGPQSSDSPGCRRLTRIPMTDCSVHSSALLSTALQISI